MLAIQISGIKSSGADSRIPSGRLGQGGVESPLAGSRKHSLPRSDSFPGLGDKLVLAPLSRFERIASL